MRHDIDHDVQESHSESVEKQRITEGLGVVVNAHKEPLCSVVVFVKLRKVRAQWGKVENRKAETRWQQEKCRDTRIASPLTPLLRQGPENPAGAGGAVCMVVFVNEHPLELVK
ncbi:hypothetical protein [Arthrobacter polaris]|uniref:hypothetical protein n=1 Tax=Arthrobacter polaris TaxID=2813727 RepID=UPI001F3251EF|nr:hypothetical protein [Arthrobacter polaris]